MATVGSHDADVMLFFLVLSCVVLVTEEWIPPSHEHGAIQMGIPNDHCDNAMWNLEVDWDFTTDFEYNCQPNEQEIPVRKKTSIISCLDNEDIPLPLHKCMTKEIHYKDIPPRGGPHRPLWPVYGEYLYAPPQRWVHSLEHGAVVFLYHPCADPVEVESLKRIARLCLRRHIITPYRHLTLDRPLAVITYGCKLTMSEVNVEETVEFIKENAFNPKRASESHTWKNGQYTFGLVRASKAIPGSDEQDSNLCPYFTDD